MKKKRKENLMEWILKGLGLLIVAIAGFFLAEYTRDFRERFPQGMMEVDIINVESDYQLDLTLRDKTDTPFKFYKVKDGERIYLDPGGYQYSIFLGDLLIQSGVIEIKRRKSSTLKIDSLPRPGFHFTLNTDRNTYGPGDPIWITFSATKRCWLYLFSKKNNQFKRLGRSIHIEPYKVTSIDKIAANTEPGEDNIIGIAILRNDESKLETAINWLKSGGKAAALPENADWRTRWITFFIK